MSLKEDWTKWTPRIWRPIEESEAAAEQQHTPMEEAEVENIGALVDQYGDWHLAPGHHWQPKKQIRAVVGASRS